MSNQLVPTLPQKGIMKLVDANHLSAVEHALAMNDLSKLTTEQRVSYYNAVCESVGLNPLTQPFAYIVLDGRLTLYARKECSEQLRKLNSVSTQILEKNETEDFYEVHVRAGDRSGRVEEDFASIYLYDKYGKKLAGTNLANAKMKCVTKAKRRVTLAISGLGVLDESELDSIDQSKIKVTENPQLPAPFEKETEQIQAPAEPAISEPVKYDFENYIIGVGRDMKGKKLSDFTVDQHNQMLDYFDREKKKGAISAAASAYYEITDAYISMKIKESEKVQT